MARRRSTLEGPSKELFDTISKNIRAIEGVGVKTERKFRQAGIFTTDDLQFKAPDELAQEVGIGETRAKNIIEGAGFIPMETETERQQRQKREAEKQAEPEFDDWKGIFPFPKNYVAAEARHESRSQKAQDTDELFRAAITTDYDRWVRNPDRYDFPGVDTPPNPTDDMLRRMDKDLER